MQEIKTRKRKPTCAPDIVIINVIVVVSGLHEL